MSRLKWTVLSGGAEGLELEDGQTLRLLSAAETLSARREAEELALDGVERALCANACLLARALERDSEPVFRDGDAVLAGMTARQIGVLAGRWAAFDREENPTAGDEEQVNVLKKAWSTRRTPGFAGVCSGPLRPCPRKHE